MKLSNLILDRIITDLTFSRDLSAVLGVKQSSVEATAKRVKSGSSPGFSLTQGIAIGFYKDQGFTEEQIFEVTEPAK